jgi:predicted DNA-binding protein with PD1-like motif
VFKKTHIFRVKPGQELLTEILKYCRQNDVTSGIIIGIVGSAKNARINYLKELPGKYVSENYEGPLEIVAAQGSIALQGSEIIIHIHILLTSQTACFGGHLAEARIFSSAEVTIGELDTQLNRYADTYTGLNELLQ